MQLPNYRDLCLLDAFVHNSMSADMERAQGRPFLRSGVKPRRGQRVEVVCNTTSNVQFQLSGEVVSIALPPTKLPCPMMCSCDEKGSFMVATTISSNNDDFQSEFSSLINFQSNEPCPCGDSTCTCEFFIDPKSWECTGNDFKKRVAHAVVDKWGFKPGQKITVQARLNFDYDLKRSTSSGPWDDGIPVDGRDVWQFDLIVDESMKNKLVADLRSFRNLGRKVQPRCWPWSQENVLPVKRGAHQKEFSPHRTTFCIGPFGCPCNNHSHS